MLDLPLQFWPGNNGMNSNSETIFAFYTADPDAERL